MSKNGGSPSPNGITHVTVAAFVAALVTSLRGERA